MMKTLILIALILFFNCFIHLFTSYEILGYTTLNTIAILLLIVVFIEERRWL